MNRVHSIVSFHAVSLCVVDLLKRYCGNGTISYRNFVCCIDLGDFYVWERCIWVLEFG